MPNTASNNNSDDREVWFDTSPIIPFYEQMATAGFVYNDGTNLGDRNLNHYQQRQLRRMEQDRMDYQNRLGREREDIERELEEANMGRTDPFVFLCDYCHRGITQNDEERNPGRQEEDRYSCFSCVSNYFCRCINCAESREIQFMCRDIQQHLVCAECFHKYYTCDRCNLLCLDELISEEDSRGDRFCPGCLEITNNTMQEDEDRDWDDFDSDEDVDEDDDNVWRNYSNKIHRKFCSKDHGDIVKSTRIFSAELETQYPDRKILAQVSLQVPKEIGVTTDGSISNRGVEWQTPKLQGKNGEETMKKFCNLLTTTGFTTDVSCGLHIHLDGGKDFLPQSNISTGNFSAQNVKMLFLAYLIFEDVIHSFLPSSRRRNQYCKPMKDGYHVSEILNAYSLEDLEKVWYRVNTPSFLSNCKSDRKHHSRYSGANLHTLLSANHLEIRYHSGTTIGIKVLEWVNLHCLIMDAVAKGTLNMSVIESAQEEIDLEEKTALLFKAIGLETKSVGYFLKRQEKFKKRSKVGEGEFKN